MTIRPLRDWVLVKLCEVVGRTAGGILVSETFEKKQGRRATVLACGPGRHLDDGTWEPMCVEKGERVILAGAAGAELDGQRDTLLVRSGEILCVEEGT